MKFKGHALKFGAREYTLKDQLGEGGFSVIYSTNIQEVVCKVHVLSNRNIEQAYKHEKMALQELAHNNIVKMLAVKEQKITDSNIGFMILENCPRGTAFTILEKEPDNVGEKTILTIMNAVASGLEYMHSKGFSHRDIKLQNVLVNQKGEFKLCDFGSSSKKVIKNINNENRADIEDFIEKTTTPIYRCPEQLDLYSGYQIGPQVDTFALGVLGFILCFKKQPFETRLSAINKQFFLNEDHPYSQELMKLIIDCFQTNPAKRPTASLVKKRLESIMTKKRVQISLNLTRELNQTADEIGRTNEKSIKQTSVAETSFFDKIKRIYSQITTETEGWTIGFIEDNEEAPNLKFNRFIISKCWEKKYKVEKFYSLLWKFSSQNKSRCLVTLKLLTLLHNFLRKGPVEGLEPNQENSPIKLCSKIYMNWKITQKSINEDDFKRNTYVMLLIRMYCLVIIAKVKLCYENSDLIEGNYSIVPFLMSPETKTILKIPFIESMLEFLEICTRFHEALHKHSYLIDLQRSMILSIVDEEYCLVSTLTFVLCAFKRAICYSQDDLDLSRLIPKLNQLQTRFKQQYVRLHDLFKATSKFASLFEHNEFQLSLKVLDYMSSIQVANNKLQQQFSINKFLNYKDSIFGLKIPLTYEEVIKNPNFLKQLDSKNIRSKQYIQLHDYKAEAKEKEKVSSFKPSKQEEEGNNKKDTNKISKADFESFTLSIQEKQQEKITQKNKDIFKTMDFTHQNLNKDFQTFNEKPVREDKFADFMSIVDEKYDHDIKKKTKTQESPNNPKVQPEQKQNNNVQNLNDASKEVYQSMTNQTNKINKIELINFFQDEESKPPIKQDSPNKSSSVIKQETPKKQKQEFNNQERPPSNSEEKEVKKSPVDHLLMEQKKQMISKIKEINICQETSKSESFIDLKGFIVEEVKKSAEQYFIQYSALKFQKKIGFGHSSEVFKGKWRGREVAIKKIKDDIRSPGAEKQFKREIMTSVKIRHHPQLVTLIGVAQHQNFYYIINQYCNGATLFDILHESKVPLPWRTRANIAKQIAKGMVFLHTNQPPIIHRDLKSLNVLLVNKYSDKHPDSMQIKIADFGLSRDFASTYMTGVLGTYHWMAPQIFNNQPYSLKADVYSFGIVLYEIAARKPPYLNMKNHQALMKFVTLENGRPDLTQIANDCPQELIKLMVKCWDKDPLLRPDFQEIQQILCMVQFF